MYVLIIGGGRLGEEAALRLRSAGHDVAIVEKRAARIDELRRALGEVTVVHGDGDEPAVLEMAGVSRAHAMVAATDEDEDNLVACLLARREYGVRATYARVNSPENEWLFGGRFGVDLALPKGTWDMAALVASIDAAAGV